MLHVKLSQQCELLVNILFNWFMLINWNSEYFNLCLLESCPGTAYRIMLSRAVLRMEFSGAFT